MQVSQKNSTITILGPVLDQKHETDLMERIGRVGQILNKKPELKNDKEVMTITKDDLNLLTADELWSYIGTGIKRLVIEGKPITYKKGFLKLFLGYRPSIEDLTDMYTLQFNDGNMVLSKAALRLCGDYFESEFSNTTIENIKKTFQFGKIAHENSKDILESEITQKGFRDILRAIETEEYEFENYPEEFKVAAEYLQFSVSLELPETVIGQDRLEKYLGDVGEVPNPPKEFFQALEAPCPYSNDETIKTKDTHIAIWIPNQIGKDRPSLKRVEACTNSEKSGENRICFDQGQCNFPEGIADEEVEGGYWLLMLKEPLKATQKMRYEDASKYVTENYKNYDVPLTIDATLCALLNYVCSGEKKERILAKENSLIFTWCKEGGKTDFGLWHMVVGRLTGVYAHEVRIGKYYPSAFIEVQARLNVGYEFIGVCPVRKFYP
jgi:hypothetical protein